MRGSLWLVGLFVGLGLLGRVEAGRITFRKRRLKQCDPRSIEKHTHTFSSLMQAEEECIRQGKLCNHVYDQGCDGQGPFYLCMRGRGRLQPETKYRDCVYSKHVPSQHWAKQPHKHCAFHRSNTTYKTLAAAKQACTKLASACSAVYDPSCDRAGKFYVCHAGYPQATSSDSCIYTRKLTCSSAGFFSSCAKDSTLNSGNVIAMCHGTCARFLTSNNAICVTSPPKGTSLMTMTTLEHFVRMCAKVTAQSMRGASLLPRA